MPDDDATESVRLRPGVGVGGTEPNIPEVVSAEVEAVGFDKQDKSRFSSRLATRCN